MKKAFILFHSYHLNDLEESKLIGIYSSKERAQSAIENLKEKNGFKYYPDAFVIDEYEIDKDNWTEGFATMITIQVKNKSNQWTTVQAECLPNEQYQIHELYDADSLLDFQHLDIIKCETRDNALYAIELIRRDKR